MKCYGDAEVGCCSVGVLHYYGTAVLWCCSVVCDDVWLLLCHCCDVTVSLICLNGCFSVSESMSVTYRQTDRQTDRATTRGPIGPKKRFIEHKNTYKNTLTLLRHYFALHIFSAVHTV